jgi:hypothetical protein
MNNFLKIALVLILVATYAFSFKVSEDKTTTPPKPVDTKLQQQVVDIFQKSCATGGCHKGLYPKKKLNLEPEKYLDAVIDKPSLQIDSLKLVDTQSPAKSYLLMKVKGSEGIVEAKMPVDAPPLADAEIKTLEAWIHSHSKTDVKKVEIKTEESKKKLK